MKETGDAPLQLYRIWIAGYDDWQPTDWHDVPPRAIALEPAEASALSAAQARSFLEGFNTQMLRNQVLHQTRRLWAVAVPVVLRYDGDTHSGETVVGQRL
jgi:hypothetical protein